MKIALIAAPFIPVPPKRYGGIELVIAQLARGLRLEGIDVTVYTNGESTIDVPFRWLYPNSDWPLQEDAEPVLKELNHAAWAIKDAVGEADLIHLNSPPALSMSKFVSTPIVYSVHHRSEPQVAHYYQNFSEAFYVTASNFQLARFPLPQIRTIHYGLDPSLYSLQEKKQDYLSFLGRIAPIKGTHLAIEIAHKAGIPLKIAAEISPRHKNYWETMVKPHVDGKFIEYLGEVGMKEKNDLLSNSRALLFPVTFPEAFGIVMIEAMACGTPVLAMPGGAVREIVREGVSGYVRDTVDELVECLPTLKLPARPIREYMECFFSAERMTRDYVNLYSEILGAR